MESAATAVPCRILGLPNELGEMIYNYVLDDALQLLGPAYGFEGIGSAISQVCRNWRSDFFQALARMLLPRRLEGIGRKLRVEQALWFWDLVELADFFHGNTGLNHHNVLCTIEFISVAYVDLHYARACEWTTAWAYQAFERLYRAQRNGLLPELKWVELRVPIGGSSWDPVGAFHGPGIWNLLKLRGLQKFIVSTLHRGLIPPNLRRALQECTSRPLGRLWPRLKGLPTLLDLMPERYAGKVVRQHEFFEEVDQFGFLERMY